MPRCCSRGSSFFDDESLADMTDGWPIQAWFWLEWGCSGLPRSPGLRLGLALALEIERHGSADEILQGRHIDLAAFVDIDSTPDIPVEAGIE